MSSSSKLTICIILAMLIAAMAIIAVIAVWAARKQVFLSFIDVRYKSMEVTGQASARWKVGHENWQDMTVGGEADGDTILTFGEAVNDSSSLSPTNKNILLSSLNNYIVFEYKFTNTGSNEYAIDLFYTDDEIKDTNISVFSLNSDEEITTDFEENINTAYVDWTNTKISGNGGTKYVYILASVTQLGKDAKYSGSFQFNLDGKDYSDDLEIDSTGTITGLKNDNLSVVRIPSEINGVAVKKIAKGAFADKSTLIELTIPDSVEEIKSGALNNGCSNLKYISIPFVGKTRTTYYNDSKFSYIFGDSSNSNSLPTTLTNVIITDATLIGERAFWYCKNLKSIIIPNGVKTIHAWAFQECTGLIGCLTIPSSVLVIDLSAFSGCTGLTGNLTIPGSVISIRSYAFQNCRGLTGNLTIPGSVTSMGSGVFYKCRGLTSLTIEDGVTNIGNSAFYYCEGLTGNLTIPSSVTSIGDYAFTNCRGLESLTLEEGVETIGEQAFYECTGLTGKLTIPSSVTSIGTKAFYDCCKLSGNLTIPNSIKSVGDSAFYYCEGLTSLTIEEGVTTIGKEAFYYCRGFTGDLYIPESITTIGNGAFKGCSGFTNIQVNSNNKNYTSRDNAGTECNCLIDLTNKTLILGCNISIIPVDGSVTSIGDNAFYKCIGLTGQLAITNSVTSIGDAAFAGCKGLTSLTIEEGVNAIGESAFSSCSGLTGKLTIPGSVTEIGRYAFSSCSGLTSLTIEEGVKYIRSYAFQYCSGLTSVIISSTVRGIEWLAFLNCDELGNVTIDSGYIYTNAELFSCGQIFYNAETIRVLSNLVVEGHKFFNSTYFIMGSTEMDGEKEYTMYKSKYSH